MKKLFLTVAVAAVALAANAQVYVGGELGFWRSTDNNHTSLAIKPEVGYQLSDKWDLGIGLGYNYDYVGKGEIDGETALKNKINSFEVNPYARWSYAKFGPVRLFLDMTFGINTYKTKYEVLDPTAGLRGTDKYVSKTSDAQVGWRVGVQPGIAVGLTKNIDFIAHVGFLGYQDADDDYCSYGEQGFGFNVSSNNLNFGFVYKF